MISRMKLHRYITGLLLLCFSAFLGHNLVPHHHHSEVYHSPIATDCPFEHGDHQEHDHQHDASEHPLHCHAFNDVVFEKNGHYIHNPGSGQVLTIVLPPQAFVPEALPLLTTSPISLLKLPVRSHTGLETRALRAPPSFA